MATVQYSGGNVCWKKIAIALELVILCFCVFSMFADDWYYNIFTLLVEIAILCLLILGFLKPPQPCFAIAVGIGILFEAALCLCLAFLCFKIYTTGG
uniref:NADH dehydrogenase subunit 4L n=1 Tax=Panagrolaimus sp. ES5 TaxID=591445 RepID=A0AC34GCF7_9BILA